jgi:hypothetical protein
MKALIVNECYGIMLLRIMFFVKLQTFAIDWGRGLDRADLKSKLARRLSVSSNDPPPSLEGVSKILVLSPLDIIQTLGGNVDTT